jgi:hypothetical protein
MKKWFLFLLIMFAATPAFAVPEGAKYVHELRDGGGTLINKNVLEVRDGKVISTDYAVAGSRDAGTSMTMWGMLNGNRADICCGAPGTLGGDPKSKYYVEFSEDGNQATRHFIIPNGQDVETLNYRRSS